MKLNKKYTIGWILWIIGFLGLEYAAIKDRRKGDTLSEHVREAIGTNTPTRTVIMWTARIVLGGLIAWLVPHFFTGAI